ncbi:MAG: GHKL domain-containing protein [Myxococcota bacterium]
MDSLRPLCFAVLALVGCPGESDSAVIWEDAQRRWRQAQATGADIGVYDAWLGIDRESVEGQIARGRLSEADPHYREAIRRLRAGEDDVLESFVQGQRVGPMNPELYYPLAQACRDQELIPRAKEYYRKYLLARPYGPNSGPARRELEALPPDPLDPPGPFLAPPAEPPLVPRRSYAVPLAAAGGAGAALLLVLAFASWRRRGASLADIARANPELHPAIAYLVGSLRHELIKHRIGAVGDAVDALQRGETSRDQLEFLRGRLYGGEPLLSAWEGHVRTFERALGYRLDLRNDRWFRRARRSILRIARLEDGLRRGEARTGAILAREHRSLKEFDVYLAELVRDLVRTDVDESLLQTVLDEVRGEYAVGQVELDEVEVEGWEEPVQVEVFQVDLVLILKNIVRNAILAVGRASEPRQIRLAVDVDLELTGEEVVRVRVADTSSESLTTQAIHDRRVDRGLGLVTAALTRYDGAIEVEAMEPPFVKAVTIRLFRALDE